MNKKVVGAAAVLLTLFCAVPHPPVAAAPASSRQLNITLEGNEPPVAAPQVATLEQHATVVLGASGQRPGGAPSAPAARPPLSSPTATAPAARQGAPAQRQVLASRQ
ncbi:MAG: hypothetical protein QHJ73_12650, partial [Armatimonadota bacterium]|nr:hypothetical protein [Armatimonadota bacterium]